MPTSVRRIARLALVFSLFSAAAPAAWADPTPADKASARDFMRDGKELRTRGDHPGALRKFRAAYGLVPSPVTGLAVAQEEIVAGHLVEARELLSAIERMPVGATETQDGQRARQDASAALAELVVRIPVLELVVKGAAAGETVTLAVDGRPVPQLAAAEGVRVNPGPHTVTASLAGRPDQTQALELKERERRKVELTFPPASAPEPTKVEPTKPESKPEPPGTRVVVDSPAPRTASPRKTAGLLTAGAGVVMAGVGGALALLAKGDYDDAKQAHCPGGVCTPEGKTLTDDARSQATVATIVLGIGGAVAATGVVLWLTAPRATPAATTGLSVGPRGVSLVGRF